MTDLLAPYISPDNKILHFDLTEDAVRTGVLDGMEVARGRIAAIKAQANPDFANTITALEQADEEMSFISSHFYNLLYTMSNDARQALAQELGPIFAAFGNEVGHDKALFAKVDAVYQQRGKLTLTEEEKTLLDNTWIGFVRNGANLDEDTQHKLQAIDARLSILGPQYAENDLKATNDFIVWCDVDDVKGLPETALAQARETATEKGGEKEYALTLHYPSYGPAMTYLESRDLREKLWRAAGNVANGGSFDNNPVALEIAKLRDERAQILGFPNHAAMALDRRMAKTVERVEKFLDDLAVVAKKKALVELEELKQFAGINLKPWDTGYYSEKLRQQKFAFSAEDVRPYFPLETVLNGTFAHFEKLFGVKFIEQKDAPIWHKDVQCFEVQDKATGTKMGTLYTDFFPRESKRSGAWKMTVRDRGLFRGGIAHPIAATVYNFTKPAEGKPSLLNFGEVETIFHEFGHAMHAILSTGKHSSLSGCNVFRDFVELPSQVQENWLMEDETLDLVSGHYETGEKLPQELVNKMRAAATFQSGMFNLRQLTLGKLDMAWHTLSGKKVDDVLAFERKVVEPFALMPYEGGCTSSHFDHIFAGGYSAGYYGYLWAEVLDADVFDLFKEKGLYDQATAQSYRKEILEKGGAEDPMKLFVAFRGREPDPNAMLRRKGLIEDRAA